MPRPDGASVSKEEAGIAGPPVLARVLLAVAALVMAGNAAGADAPAPKLDAVVSAVASKPVTVHCETSPTGWAALVGTNLGTTTDASLIQGFAVIGGDVVYVSPANCYALRYRSKLGTRPVAFGGALDVLIHEALHAQGLADEGVVECRAYTQVEAVAITHFGYTPGTFPLSRLLAGARQMHEQFLPVYRSIC